MIVAAIGAFTSLVGMALSAVIYLHVRTPSGDTIGRVAERTHDLSAADLAATTQLLGHLNGETETERG